MANASVAVKESQEVARPLKVLVPLIQQEIKAGKAAGVEHFRRAGEMLLEAKEQVAHGDWGPWLDRNFHLHQSTARTWMQLAKMTAKQNKRIIANFRSMQEVLQRPSQEDSRPRPPAYHEPVQRVVGRVNVGRLAQERQDKEKERRLMRQLALQLIDIGYKVLATKLHPDKGGSVEAMARLNRVRVVLKQAI